MEGIKSVLELLHSDYSTKLLLCSPEYTHTLQPLVGKSTEFYQTTPLEIASVSAMENNTTALAVAATKEQVPVSLSPETGYLVLDNLQDPGNMGTIVRTADWFGVQHVVCSPGTVDVYNPKVINATKGSFTRVNMYYEPLQIVLSHAKEIGIPVVGTFLNGHPLHTFEKTTGLWVIGNESNGISEELWPYIPHKATIPALGKAESLNAGVATGIILYHFLSR